MRRSAMVLAAGLAVCAQIPFALGAPLPVSSETTAARQCLDGKAYTPEDAVETCTLALEDRGLGRTDRITVYAQLGDALYYVDQDRARDVYSAALVEYPDAPGLVTGLGWLDWGQGNNQTCYDLFTRALELAPSAEAMAGMAGCGRMGDLMTVQEAQTLLEQALFIAPEYPWATRELGFVKLDLLDFEGALPYAIKAIELEPNNQSSHYLMYRVQYELADYEQALNAISTVIEINPEVGSYYWRRAEVLLMLNRPRMASLDAQRAIDADPQDLDAHVMLARAQDALGRKSDAIQTLLPLAEDFGDQVYFAYWLSLFLWQYGQYEKGLAVAAVPEEAKTSGWLSEISSDCLIGLGRFDQVEPFARRAIKTLPDRPFAYAALARAQMELGEPDRAAETFALAMDRDLEGTEVNGFIALLVAKGHLPLASKLMFRSRP